MMTKKRRKIEKAGFQITNVQQFLGLSDDEMQIVEAKVRLGRALAKEREARGLSQQKIAAAVGSSQSRVAKMEKADPSVSLDLLVSSLTKLGYKVGDIGRILVKQQRASTRRVVAHSQT